MASTPIRTMYSDTAIAPFGETYAKAGTTDVSYTGQNQDTVAGDYDFPDREYGSVSGRWPSPDPAGVAAVDPSDPQTWNRYAYVRNSPLEDVDPLGLDCYVWWETDEDGTGKITGSHPAGPIFCDDYGSFDSSGGDDIGNLPLTPPPGVDTLLTQPPVLCNIDLPGLGNTVLNFDMAPRVEQWMALNAAQGINMTFTEGFRTTSYQAGLSANPHATTPAPPGHSLHEAGLAVDISWNSVTPSGVGSQLIDNATTAGLSWGGYFFKPGPDVVHFYYDPGGREAIIAQAQAQYALGVNIPCPR